MKQYKFTYYHILAVTPLEALEKEGVEFDNTIFILDLKRKEKIWGVGLDFFWEGGGTLPKIVINLPQTYEKLLCKGEQYRFSR